MNMRFSTILIVLMTLSLSGIILIQGYLIDNAFKSNQKQFFFNVKRAMNQTAEFVIEREFEYYFHPLKKTIDSLNKRSRNQTSADLIENYQSVNSDKDSLKFDNVYNKEIKKVLDKISMSLYKDANYFSIETNKTAEKEIKQLSSTDKYEFSLYESIIKDYTDEVPISKRLNIPYLRKIISENLKKRDILIDFEFCIYNNGSPTEIQTLGFEPESESTYSRSIYEYARHKNNFLLVLTFPKKKSYIWSSVSVLIVLSVLLILVIMITYYYAYHKILQQRKISEIKTDFINNMAHELKTPVASINLALDFIKNPSILKNEEIYKRYITMIRFENKRILDQVHNVLEIAKLEKKQVNLEKKSEDLHEIIEESIAHIGIIIENKGGIITTNLNAINTKILANKNAFTNLIINILDNSVKYTDDTPKININTENVKKSVILKIKDEGIGISRQDLDKIFDKFYRVPKGNVHNVKGHGLGLSYVKQIVDDHQSEISVQSNKNKGTTFIIKVPLIL